MRGITVSVVITVALLSVSAIGLDVAGVQVPVPTYGESVTWQEYEWGDMTGAVTPNGVTVSGLYTGAETTPYTGGWNSYFLLSSETFNDGIAFSCNITPSVLSCGEAMLGIGIRSPSVMDDVYRDSIVWCMYYYPSAGVNTVGWLHKCIDGSYERITLDSTDIVLGATVQYKIVVSDGIVGYFLNDIHLGSEIVPFTEFSLLLTAGLKYDGSVITADLEDVSVLPVGSGTVPSLLLHAPISIGSNAEFTAARGVTSGSGTATDPYIIEGWIIPNAYIAILIANTDAHFIIRDVKLLDGLGGVYFYTVSNGSVEHSSISGFDHAGIAVWSSTDIRVECVDTGNNGHEGIIFRDSRNVTLTGNTVHHNAWQGIMLETCTQSTLVDNRIEDNVYEDDSGIYPYQAGIVLFSCSSVSVFHNAMIEDSGEHAYDDTQASNSWDAGYPTGGNYWSDYLGTDIYAGPNQDMWGPDGIGDTPYLSVPENDWLMDNYPLVTPYGIGSVQFDTNSSSIIPLSVYGTIRVTVLDTVRQPMTGVTVVFDASSDSLWMSATEGVSNDAGEVEITVSSPVACVCSITATVAPAISSNWTLVVYDASGMAAGGGWYYPLDDTGAPMPGTASFGFIAHYVKGSAAGTLEFQYHVDDALSLKSTSIEWLVVSGSNAQFKGRATLNDVEGYTFSVIAHDGTDGDTFSIWIWDPDGTLVHSSHNALEGGNIIVRTKTSASVIGADPMFAGGAIAMLSLLLAVLAFSLKSIVSRARSILGRQVSGSLRDCPGDPVKASKRTRKLRYQCAVADLL